MKRKLFLLLCALLTSVGMWAETDVTSLLTNPDFTSGTSGWTGFGSDKSKAFVIAENTTFKGSNDKNAEMWIAQNKTLGAGEINQKISNLTAGVYRLTVNMRSDVKCYLFAEINSAKQKYNSVKVAGVTEIELVFIVPKTGDVTIGFGTDGTSLNTYNWIAVDDFKLYRVGDVGETELTSQIANWHFTDCAGGWEISTNFPGWSVSNPNSGNAWAHNVNEVNTAVEYYKNPASEGSFDYYQSITGLPNGKYTLSASMWYTADTGECGVYGTSTHGTVFKGVTDNCDDTNLHTYTTDGILVTDGTLRVGVKNNATMSARWFGVDWIKLTYLSNEVNDYSPTSFSSGGSATADTWYEFNISTAGIYKITSSEAVTFYYTQDGSDDADDTESVSITASGYTTLDLSSDKLYFKSSAASTVTISSLVPDGTYYLYDATNKLFLGKGKNWGTRAVVDEYGVPFTWSNSTKLISFVDWANTSLFFDNSTHSSSWVYTDGDADKGDDRLMAFTDAGDGKVYLQDAAKDVWIKHDNSVLNVPDISATNATKWTVMTKAEHDAIVNAYPAENKTAVITASGISTTAGDFETYINAHYATADKTALINAISSNNAKGEGWTWYETDRKNAGWPNYNPSPYARLWKNTGYFTYSVAKSNLPAGIYKVEMQAYDRRAGRSSEKALYEAYGNIGASYLEANGQKVRIRNIEEILAAHSLSGVEWPDDQKTVLDNNYATNVVYVYLDGDTDLDLKIEKPDYTSDCCLSFGKVKLTYYKLNTKDIVDNKGDITSLINGTFDTDATGWTGGGIVKNLARSWRSSSVVNQFYETTSNGTLSCTVSNMPAGTYKVVAASRAAAGCTITPQIAGTSGSALTGVGDTRNENSPASEINLNGVEMPYSTLGGFTTNGWGHNWQWITATGTLAADGDLVINFICNADGKTGDDSWMPIDDVHLYCTELEGVSYTYTVDDDHTDAGSKAVTADIKLSNPNTIISSIAAINGAAGAINNNLVSGTIAKLVLYDGSDFTAPDGSYAATAATLYRSIAANKWISLVLPFVPTTKFSDEKVPSGLSEGTLFFADATPANDAPMMVRNTSVISEIVGARADGTTGNLKAGEGAPMVGVYKAGTVPVSEEGYTRYVVSGNQMRKVTSKVNINPFRAYFELEGDDLGARIALNLDNATAINTIEAAEAEEGVLKDGKYLIDGKIVIVKNGVKYDANGKKLN